MAEGATRIFGPGRAKSDTGDFERQRDELHAKIGQLTVEVDFLRKKSRQRGGNRQSLARRLARGTPLHPAPVAGGVARFHQNLMADCDQQIASRMNALEDRGAGPPPVTGKKKGNKTHEEPMREQLYEKFGVDLSAVEGVSIQTCLAFLSEVGTDVGKFATAEHFASWMGLCPDNRITGGRTHAAHTRKVQNRLANALRMAAQSLHRSKAGLGDWFRRLKAKLGTKAAVTAAAHKLARILWAMVKHRRPYDPQRLGNPELTRARKERYLRLQAEQLGFALTPVGGEPS